MESTVEAPKIVKAEGPDEVERVVQSGIANDQEAQAKGKNILQNFKELKSYTGRWGVNEKGEYILIFKVKAKGPKP